ncbi:SET domain-containing protein 9 isoform X2 [Ornithorhynchus anatinus]|uniref:SET domain-containing protein 9 isoform X2 n=1 Tax=Ornithorhynchus anatinus TaxID=9258 RepID=UPI0010A757D8|nr:SET domain-containing protein 9 isoform X2 [Ornithorhynchus anatinus]
MLVRWAAAALRRRWRRYRYRFVPWIALNLGRARTTVRLVPEASQDKTIADEEVLETLLKVFQALYLNDLGGQTDAFALLPEAVKSKYRHLLALRPPRANPPRDGLPRPPNVLSPGEVLFRTAGFSVARETSSLVSAGKGVFVTKGFVPKGAVVSMYPGTIYQMSEPIFFQSIGNPFIFRCIDGVLIDGNDKGISKAVYRSCSGRDQLGPFKMSDSTWLTSSVQNPLAVGQYVNNCSNAQ